MDFWKLHHQTSWPCITTFMALHKGGEDPVAAPAKRIPTHTRDGRKVTQGRLPIPPFMMTEMPNGYDPRLCELDDDGQRKYADVPVRWFKDNQEELLGLVRQHIHPIGFGRPPVAALFRARAAIQRWMIDKLEVEYGNGE